MNTPFDIQWDDDLWLARIAGSTPSTSPTSSTTTDSQTPQPVVVTKPNTANASTERHTSTPLVPRSATTHPQEAPAGTNETETSAVYDTIFHTTTLSQGTSIPMMPQNADAIDTVSAPPLSAASSTKELPTGTGVEEADPSAEATQRTASSSNPETVGISPSTTPITPSAGTLKASATPPTMETSLEYETTNDRATSFPAAPLWGIDLEPMANLRPARLTPTSIDTANEESTHNGSTLHSQSYSDTLSRTEVDTMIDRRLAELKVYVLESEITEAQQSVKAVVQQATF